MLVGTSAIIYVVPSGFYPVNNLGCEHLIYTSYTSVYIDVAATRVEAYSKEEYIASEGETFRRYIAQEQLEAWMRQTVHNYTYILPPS